MSARYCKYGKSIAVEVSGSKVLKRGKRPNEWIRIQKLWDYKYENGVLHVRFKDGPWLKVK